FPTKNLAELVLNAGCECRHDLEKGTLKLSQAAYIQRILDSFSATRTAATPAYVSPSFKIDKGEGFRGRDSSDEWVAYADADDATFDDRRSVSGGAIFFCAAVVGFFSRTQKNVTLSMTQAECVAMEDVMKDALFV
ncbi:unnamed protein product, partial [Sphacelaria rigidula]